MADQSKDHFGGNQCHSVHKAKKHQSSTDNPSTKASQPPAQASSNDQRLNSIKKQKSSTRNSNTGSEDSFALLSQIETSTSRSLRYTRRSTSTARHKLQETTASGAEAVATDTPLAERAHSVSDNLIAETQAVKGHARKRSFATSLSKDPSEISSESHSKKLRSSFESEELFGNANEESIDTPLIGIRAALRSNRQAALVTGLSPHRRRSGSKLFPGTVSSVSAALEPESSKISELVTSSELAVISAGAKGTTPKARQRGGTKKDREKTDQLIAAKPKPGTKKRFTADSSSVGNTDPQATSSSSGQQLQQPQQPQQKSSKGKKHCSTDPGVVSRNKAPKTTGSCASNRRRASVVVGSKQSAPTASASTNSLTVGPSSVFKQSTMSSGQDSDAVQSPNQGQAAAAAGHEASADVGATASAVPGLGSFASLIQTLDQDSNDVGRLQALLESRGLPSQLFSALGPRMHQILHRSMIGGSASKAQQLLQGLQSKDEGQQLTATIEMCQLLVMGNEDTLAGFPIKQVVPALITLLQMEHNFDIMNNACRALTYMMEALPRSSAVVVEAVPVFLQKLQAIQCMDVAEQSLQALEMLSKKHNKAILHANGVLACLTYIDFFSMTAQRAALAITANCCQTMTVEEFHYVQESLPMLSARLTQQDKKSLESVCLCMARLVDNYQTDERILQEIASHGLLTNIQQLLMITPPIFSTGMFVTVVRMLVLMCSNCPDLAVQLLKLNIAETLCFLLVGPSPQGATQTIELVSRTPQELYEIVCLIGELLPKLPRDGLFAVDSLLRKNTNQCADAVSWQWLDDHGLWHPYSLIDSRIIEAAHQSGEHEVSLTIYGGNYTIDFDSMQQINDDTGTARHVQRKINSLAAVTAAAVSRSVMVKSDSREDILHEDTGLAGTFIKTLFCVLYEVYSSSAGPSVRHKCLQAIMRMIYYGSPELLKYVLPSCNVSSHLAAMMASNDLKVVVAGIQMANILMEKLPDVFNVYFCREGVMHQIKRLCESEVIDLSTKKEISEPAAASATSASSLLLGGGSSTGISCTSSFLPSLPSSSKEMASSPKKMDPLPVISTETEKPSSPSPRLRLSSVLKHKKPPKRGAVGGGSGSNRKSSKNEIGLEMLGGVMGESSAGATSSDLTPATNRGKWSGPPKGSFLAGLHPSRWGRSSSMGPDRPYPPLPAQVGLSQILHPDAMVRPPALPLRPHIVDNRDKIKQWITEQAMKFSEKYFGVESSHVTSHPALSTLNLLCSATSSLSNLSQEVESLQEIARIIKDSDMSPFEVIHSGLVGTLLTYLTAGDAALRDVHIRRFLLVFLGCNGAMDGIADVEVIQPDSFASLVSKLMTCFHHLEQFQVKVHDLPSGSAASGRGSNALRFFDSHQLKCNLQRHTSCTNLKQWKGGPVKIDPLALVQAIERYLIVRGYGRVRSNVDNDCSDDDDASDDDIDDTLAAVTMSQGTGRHRIEFLINDHVLPYNMTVYEAVKQFSNAMERENTETDTDSEYLYGNTGIWINTHTIWFRPASDPEATGDLASSPKKTKSDKSRGRHTSKSNREGDSVVRASPLEEYLAPSLPASVTVKDPSMQVLALLRLLHAINRYWGTLFEKSNAHLLISNQEFISNKLTAKANRQLQDPLVIMTGNMPQWLIQIGRACPFLLPFDTRLSLFYATTLDRDRALHRLQDASHEPGQTDGSERVTPRLERRKSIVSRDDILKQAEKVLNELGSSKAILEIQYENEVGTGLGPTLEFYTLVSRELQRIDLELWRGEPVKMKDNKGNDDGLLYLFASCGLFPLPIPRTAKATSVNKIKSKFRFLGRFMAKALMDSRMLDLPLSQTFYKWMLGHEQTLGPDDMHYVDPAVAKTFTQLQEILRQKKRIDGDKSHTAESRHLALESLTLDGCSVEDLDLDFVLPGFPNIELKKGGKDIPLTLDNLEEYLKSVLHWSLVEGTRRQFESFREGFESILPLFSLSVFYPEEMDQLFCGNFHEPWTVKYLMESCRPDHGYNHDSVAIKYLFEILSSYTADEQRMFIQFMTGSPRLPIGGLKSLVPPLTVVRKIAEANENPDDSLPSVMTCVNYLKLPEYSSLEKMRERLSLAAREGQLSFHLS